MSKFNWKTTVGGALTGLGQILIASPSPVAWWIGKGCLLFGPILLGTAAMDSANIKDEAKH